MRRSKRPYRAQRGSVYIITLVVLLVLTVLGLSVALITQSEMQIGINERLGQTMFYAAGSGIDVSTAKALVAQDLRAMRLDQVVPRALPGLNVRNRVDVSRFRPIMNSPCDLCQVNDGQAYKKLHHQVDATATRIGWQGPATPVPAGVSPLAQKRLEVMVSFQPWQLNPQAMIFGIGDFNQTTSDQAP
ncbi:MAG: PilX N-terminal domain-containing pilus assembly protein [Thermoanaerobaculia bacterium]